MKTLSAVFFLLLIFTFPLFAQLEGNPENFCRNGFFSSESAEYKLAGIKGSKNERVYFYGDDRNCPNDKNCQLKSYLIPSDEIIVSRTYGKWACAWYQPKKGSETVGWVALDKIEFRGTDQNPAAKDWLGAWDYAGNQIKIGKSKTANFLSITGSAFWRGAGDNIHTGEIEEELKPAGNELKIGADAESEYDCQVTMRLLGRFLIVADNMQCGGVNVTFSGVYQKK